MAFGAVLSLQPEPDPLRRNAVNVQEERSQSLWMQTDVASDAPTLTMNITAEIVVVGSGMAGLSAAYELVMAGRQVVVVDRGAIGGGMTARTTAHLAPICDDWIHELIDLRGEQNARGFQQSQHEAVDRIEEIARQQAIECDFRRVDAFLFPADDMDRDEALKQTDKEYEAARKVGAEVAKVTGVPLRGFEDAPCLRYGRQATFHPTRYLKGLAQAIRAKGGRLFANSAIVTVDEEKDHVRLVSDTDVEIIAQQAIFATNVPINNRLEIHSKMAPYRTYAMAFALPRGSLPDALYWDMADPYHYVRLSPGADGNDILIVGGADHKSGEADDQAARFEALAAWTRKLVPALGGETHRWSGQVMETLDYCGYIGRNPGNHRIFVATGDSGQGMTHGAVAGLLLRDLIVNGSSPWAEVYDPARKTLKAAGTYIRENLTAAKSFAEYLAPGDVRNVDELQPGQGGILRDGARKLAACRDLDGTLHLHSAACTHLGCLVHWNETEQCWDCPCHGSHFAPDGAVLNGPAVAPLAKA
jgi:glycine/D-amino acid oxidase-like deaminating enzyme/nitrite reductase/ring-hydroxylating ferredoxin subunit